MVLKMSQIPTSGVQHQSQVQTLMLLRHPKRLAEDCDRPGHAHPPEEDHAPASSGSRPVGTTKLVGSFCSHRPWRCCAGVWPPEARWTCSRDHLLQPGQLPPQVARAAEPPLEERLLEPAVEVRDSAVELRLPCREEQRAHAKAQAEPDHPRQGARRRPQPAARGRCRTEPAPAAPGPSRMPRGTRGSRPCCASARRGRQPRRRRPCPPRWRSVARGP